MQTDFKVYRHFGNRGDRMPERRIFLLHGIGQYGSIDPKDKKYKVDNNGWAKASTDALRASYDTFVKAKYGGGRDFDGPNGIFEVVPINYDEIFERYRQAWAKQIGEEWSEISKGWDTLDLGGDLLKRLGDFFKTAGDDEFGWTHIADVFMYAVPTIRAAVAVKVAHSIADSLADDTPVKWSIIGHSLGTSVMHDGIKELNRTIAEYRAKGKIQGGLLPPSMVCSLSNVARALTNNDNDAYATTLAPSTQDNDRPRVYLNCNHKLDLISQVDPFRPESPEWTAGKGTIYFDLSDISDFYPDVKNLDWGKTSVADTFMQLIPHGFAHYIAMPKVAGHMWPALMERPIVRTAPKIALAVQNENLKKTKKQIEEDKSVEAIVADAVNASLGNHAAIKDLPIKTVLKILLSHMGAAV